MTIAEVTGHRSFTAHIPAGDVRLHADVAIPDHAIGVVLFAEAETRRGRGTRSRYIASELNMVRMATVVVDLLTPDEAMIDGRTAAFAFNVPFLAARVVRMIDWVPTVAELESKPIGLLGASTAAAAALDASAARPGSVSAVVARAGRPDLANNLHGVSAPTLLIVGSEDDALLDCNSASLARLVCRRRLEIVPCATQSFEEPGALERVAGLAAAWFHEHL